MPKRSAAHMARRRTELLEAAKACFEEEGFDATTMVRIARRVGMSTGALYTHFKSKREIMLQILAERDAWRRNLELESLRELETVLLRGIPEELAGTTPAFRVNMNLFRASFDDEELRRALAKSTDNSHSIFGRALRHLRRAGEIRSDYDIDVGARTLVALSLGLIWWRFLDERIEPNDVRRVIGAEVRRMRLARRARSTRRPSASPGS